MDVFQVCLRVENGLHNHQTGPCLSWCHDNRSKHKSTLEYRVRLQNVIELVRQDKIVEAVKSAQLHTYSTLSQWLIQEFVVKGVVE